MSATSPLSPRSLESGKKFTFEQSLISQAHHYFIQLFRMLKCPLLLSSMFTLILLAPLLVLRLQGAPVFAHHSPRSISEDSLDDILFTALPSPPAVREERAVSSSPAPPTQTSSPVTVQLPFIKSSHCFGVTKSKMCGLRQLDLPGGANGIKSWSPGLCRPLHCRCVATKEVQRRIKRTIANNKTTVEFHRYRVFECA